MPDTDRIDLRSRGDLEAGHQQLQSRLETIISLGARGETYTRGQLAALGWILGAIEQAPLTGRVAVDVTDTWALAREQFLATDMLYGRAELDRRGRSYVVGVEHALMWVRNQTDSRL